MYQGRGCISRKGAQNFAHNERSDFVRPESGRGHKRSSEEREDGRDAKKRKMRWRTEREVSCSLTRPLRYDNISRAPGKHCQRSPEGTLPKLAAVSFVGDSSSERKRRRGGGRSPVSREGYCILSSFSSFSFSYSLHLSHFSLSLSLSFSHTRPFSRSRARALDIKREILNKTGCY